MSGFKALKDSSIRFEEELKRASADLFSIKIKENFEDVIAKKMHDLSLFTAKLRLLRADPISRSPQVYKAEIDEHTTLSDYGELATWRTIEQQTVKSIAQSHAVEKLVSTPNSSLSPEQVKRKEDIIHLLSEYDEEQCALHGINTLLRQKQDELSSLQERWDRLMAEMRDMRTEVSAQTEYSGPLYVKLQKRIAKIQLMCRLIPMLAAPRNRGYDWLADPHSRLRAIKAARKRYTIDSFVQH